MKKKLIFLILCASISVETIAQSATFRQIGELEGPIAMGKKNYPYELSNWKDKVSKIFISAPNIELTNIDATGNKDTEVKVVRVIGGYDLWLNYTSKHKEINVILEDVNGVKVTIPVHNKKQKLKTDKKYVLNLECTKPDPNEGKAYLIVQAKEKCDISIVPVNQTGDEQNISLRSGDTKNVNLQYGKYQIIKDKKIKQIVELKSEPIIINL